MFRGEAEGRLERLVLAPERPGSVAEQVLSPAGTERPDLAQARVPRFDLVDLDAYSTFAIQVSRCCPFSCEFCDIIEVFGRVPRVKSPAQVVAELEALRRLGARGPRFLVDDNFIGNRRAAAKVIEAISAWQREAGRPFDLLTEASVDLAGEPELLRAMVEAGFTAVFVGIESPSAASLREAGKPSSTRRRATSGAAPSTSRPPPSVRRRSAPARWRRWRARCGGSGSSARGAGGSGASSRWGSAAAAQRGCPGR